MSWPRRSSSLTILVAAALMTAAPGAGAATKLGQTFVPTYANSCTGAPDWESLQTSGVSGPSSQAPSAGVLTSWSFEAGSQTTVLTMRVFRPTATPNQFQTIADGSDLQTIAPASGAHTFPTRIPVQAGDFVGIRSTTGECAAVTGVSGDKGAFHVGTATNVGGFGTFTPNSTVIYDISALLEPDADRDGYGDETQDQCPTNASTQGPCPSPASAPTGARAAALAQCKKRARKHDWSHKHLRKCKQAANLLPV
jgi:hypothetical protein